MQRYIYTGLTTLFILLLLSCSAAPPVEPTTGFEPYSAPLKPANLTATNGREDTIVLTWDETEGATSYQVWAVDASSYGSESSATTRTESYATLIERGFKLLDVVSDTTYTLKGESTNSSYVFSIVAMKSVRSTSSSSVLYSEPSPFVEGSTVGEIILSAVANSEKVALFWDISNLYSVLDNSSEKTPLYSYTLTLYSKLSSSTEWNEGETVGDEEKKRNSAVIRSSTLDIDTEYDFRLKLDVMDDEGSVINSVESDVYTITTDSSLVPERVENIETNSGLKRNEVTLTWTVPALPERDDIAHAFRIDRTEDGTTWTSLDLTQLDLTHSESEGTWSVTDKTLKDNTIYTYRIVNGYTLEGKGSIFQSDADAETVKTVYSLWLPEDIEFSFTQGIDVSTGNIDIYKGTIKVSYTYEPPVASDKNNASFLIRLEKRLETELDKEPVSDEKEGTELSFEIDENEGLAYFSSYFIFEFNGVKILNVKNPEDVKLGKTNAVTNLFANLTATTNWVGVIRLSWTENEKGTYEIYEDADTIDVSAIKEDGDNRYIDISPSDSNTHNYRVKLTSASGSGAFQVQETSGKTLSLPEGLTASDSTSTEKIDITWTPSTSTDVKYTLEYSIDKTTWSELSYVLDGEASLDAKGDGTDGNEYYFRLAAINTKQGGTEPLYSEIETGSVFGAYGMNPTVENNGLDPDQITIKWNEVKGAKFYMIKRNGEKLPQKIRTTEYSDKAESIQNLKTSSTPLSEEYTYTIVPYLDDKTEAVVTDKSCATVEGKLFASPKNVKATKGETQDSITVTWDSVPKADAGYKIEKYSVTVKNGVSSYPVLKETTYTTATTYTEENSSLASSGYVQYVIYSMRKDGEETITSLQQTGSETVKNSLGFDEENNIGYGLRATSSLTVASVVNKSTGYYEPYTTVTWSFVPGATSYTLSSSAGSVEINVSDLKYPKNGTVNNGKGENEAGYLSYNADSGIYTYNDNSGLLTTPVINNYSLKACNGSAANEKTNATTVYRQPTEEDWINILMSLLKPAFTKANDYFGGDWWIPSSSTSRKTEDSYTYSSTGMNFHLYSKFWNKTYYHEKNYLNIEEYTDTERELKISTTSNIQFDYTNGGEAGYLDIDPLNLIGYDGNGCVSITPLDSKMKSVTITLKNINVRSIDTGGSYTVTISGNSAKTVTDDAKFVRVL